MDEFCGGNRHLKKCLRHPGLVASRGRLVGTECEPSRVGVSQKLKRRYDGLFHVEVGTPLLELPETLVPLEASKGHSKWIGIFGNLSQEMTYNKNSELWRLVSTVSGGETRREKRRAFRRICIGTCWGGETLDMCWVSTPPHVGDQSLAEMSAARVPWVITVTSIVSA